MIDALPPAFLTPSTRTIAYTYDGLQRLTGAVESPGSSFAYTYDLAGNRTGVTVDGTPTASYTYDAADQVTGWTYDNAGNLTSDGTTSYSYDALSHLTGTTAGTQATSYAYNGDGTLVDQTANGTTTTYTQDLASSLSQVLAATIGLTSTDYLYGQDTAPLAALSGGTRTWYGIDGQGSVRQSLDDTSTVLGVRNYDPFGQIEAGASLTGLFGYTGELQDAVTGQEYLRARWYQPGSGTLLGVDPLLDVTGQPYSYAYDDPINGSDPFGLCAWYDVVCQYNSIHTAAQQSSFGHGFYAGTTSLIHGIGTEAGAIGNTTVSCLNPFDQTNCQNQRAADAATFAYLYAHPTDALHAALAAAIEPYLCNDTAYNLGYGLPQLFLGALGAFGAIGGGGEVLAETAAVEPELTDLPIIGVAASEGATNTVRVTAGVGGIGARGPIFADNNLLVAAAEQGHAVALAEIRAGLTYVTAYQLEKFLNVLTTAQIGTRVSFLEAEGITEFGAELTEFGGHLANLLALSEDFQRVFSAVLPTQGAGDAALAAFAKVTGYDLVTMERRLYNFLTRSMPKLGVPIRRIQ